MHTGNRAIVTATMLVDGTIANAINDTTIPTPNIIRSIGLNILNISVPLFEFAGIR